LSDHKQLFAGYDSQYLLQKRALGDELSDEAHKAIEEIFAERGEELPPRPQKPIVIDQASAFERPKDRSLRVVISIALFLAAAILAKMTAQSWIGLAVAVCCVIYLGMEWLRKETLTPEQREAEKAGALGLNELMIAAADGDLVRVQELIAFGVDLDAKSSSGTTALMNAARNNRLQVVEILVAAGADVTAKSVKGSSALTIAKNSGHQELAAYLEQCGG
jgi:hypothetical protein